MSSNTFSATTWNLLQSKGVVWGDSNGAAMLVDLQQRFDELPQSRPGEKELYWFLPDHPYDVLLDALPLVEADQLHAIPEKGMKESTKNSILASLANNSTQLPDVVRRQIGHLRAYKDTTGHFCSFWVNPKPKDSGDNRNRGNPKDPRDNRVLVYYNDKGKRPGPFVLARRSRLVPFYYQVLLKNADELFKKNEALRHQGGEKFLKDLAVFFNGANCGVYIPKLGFFAKHFMFRKRPTAAQATSDQNATPIATTNQVFTPPHSRGHFGPPATTGTNNAVQAQLAKQFGQMMTVNEKRIESSNNFFNNGNQALQEERDQASRRLTMTENFLSGATEAFAEDRKHSRQLAAMYARMIPTLQSPALTGFGSPQSDGDDDSDSDDSAGGQPRATDLSASARNLSTSFNDHASAAATIASRDCNNSNRSFNSSLVLNTSQELNRSQPNTSFPGSGPGAIFQAQQSTFAMPGVAPPAQQPDLNSSLLVPDSAGSFTSLGNIGGSTNPLYTGVGVGIGQPRAAAPGGVGAFGVAGVGIGQPPAATPGGLGAPLGAAGVGVGMGQPLAYPRLQQFLQHEKVVNMSEPAASTLRNEVTDLVQSVLSSNLTDQKKESVLAILGSVDFCKPNKILKKMKQEFVDSWK